LVRTLTDILDSKQARDLINVLTESKQKIDPRLAEMARYGGGGGRGYSRGGRGGGGRGGELALTFVPARAVLTEYRL
jgi:ATP-dependent RNA helicase DDX5/DBP2